MQEVLIGNTDRPRPGARGGVPPAVTWAVWPSSSSRRAGLMKRKHRNVPVRTAAASPGTDRADVDAVLKHPGADVPESAARQILKFGFPSRLLSFTFSP